MVMILSGNRAAVKLGNIAVYELPFQSKDLSNKSQSEAYVAFKASLQ
jgi:hypothetical protein